MRAVLATGILALSILSAAGPVQAAHRHAFSNRVHLHRVVGARHHVRYSHRLRGHRPAGHAVADMIRGGLVTVHTAAGISITVAANLAARFQALIADFVAHGYRPRSIGCFAQSGHVPNSRHYAGAACDFDQRGWGMTAPFMYRARSIIASHGFRDGCSFSRPDCGHVDDGVGVGRRSRRYAQRL